MDARSRFEELLQKVEAFGARVAQRHPGALACAAGCSGCCQAGLSVTGIEAELLREGLGSLAPEVRERLAGQARAASADHCPGLDEVGRCLVYPWRPLVCRTQGLPIRLREEGREELAVCEQNFLEVEEIAADCVLDQRTLSTVLGALDAARAAELGAPAGRRFEIAAVLAGG